MLQFLSTGLSEALASQRNVLQFPPTTAVPPTPILAGGLLRKTEYHIGEGWGAYVELLDG